MKVRYGLVLVAGAASLLLAGCSGSSGGGNGVASVSGSPSSSAQASGGGTAGDDQKAFDLSVKFAQCMRAHGVDVPDPTPGGPGLRISMGDGQDADKLSKASDACKQFSPNGGAPVDASAMLAKNLKVAQCLRAHGVDVADPTLAAPALGLPPINDPKAKAAMDACLK